MSVEKVWSLKKESGSLFGSILKLQLDLCVRVTVYCMINNKYSGQSVTELVAGSHNSSQRGACVAFLSYLVLLYITAGAQHVKCMNLSVLSHIQECVNDGSAVFPQWALTLSQVSVNHRTHDTEPFKVTLTAYVIKISQEDHMNQEEAMIWNPDNKFFMLL